MLPESSGSSIKTIFLWVIGSVGPLLILIILIYCGIASAFSFFSGADEIETIDVEKCTLDELVEAVKDRRQFTDDMVTGTMLDRRSLIRLLEAVQEYNNEKLRKNVSIEHHVTWQTRTITKRTYYYTFNGETYEAEQVIEKIHNHEDDVGLDILIDHTWTRELYYMDWQIVYLLCLFHSIDYDEDVEITEEGETVRLRNSLIKQVMGALKPRFDWAANAYEYRWGVLTVKPEKVITTYGKDIYYRENEHFEPDESIYSQGYSYTGYVPVSYLRSVNTITGTDYFEDGAVDEKIWETEYDCSRLIALVNQYGNGRTMTSFLEALRELPHGNQIADNLIYCLEEGGHEYE